MKTIDKLPAGVRIQLVSISEEDSFYPEKINLEGKVFVSIEKKSSYSRWFIQEDTGEEYVFLQGTTYKIIK